jgi:hypothetical protein
MCQKIDIDWVEQHVYNQGYRKGREDALKELKTKTIKYYDDDEKVWTIGEVIVDE